MIDRSIVRKRAYDLINSRFETLVKIDQDGQEQYCYKERDGMTVTDSNIAYGLGMLLVTQCDILDSIDSASKRVDVNGRTNVRGLKVLSLTLLEMLDVLKGIAEQVRMLETSNDINQRKITDLLTELQAANVRQVKTE